MHAFAPSVLSKVVGKRLRCKQKWHLAPPPRPGILDHLFPSMRLLSSFHQNTQSLIHSFIEAQSFSSSFPGKESVHYPLTGSPIHSFDAGTRLAHPTTTESDRRVIAITSRIPDLPRGVTKDQYKASGTQIRQSSGTLHIQRNVTDND